MRHFGALAAFLLALVGTISVQSAAAITLPSGFSQSVVTGGLELPTAFELLPDGRILIAQKNGVIRVVKNGALLPTPFLDISSRVNAFGDRGLLEVTADPSFSSNGFVYVLYVFENNASQASGTKTVRVSRFTASGDTASPGSESVILGTMVGSSCNNFPVGTDCIPGDFHSHTGGTIAFASDGTMFVSTGEGGAVNSPNSNALRAQNIDLLAGKILHVTSSGAGLPPNPFWNGNASANRSKVWAYGLRNPFRMTLRPGSERPYVGDVGWRTWEEIDVAPAGANLGWPCYEGAARQPGYEPMPTCQALYAQGSGAVRGPLVAYRHADFNDSASVSGGPFYTGTAFPAAYQGAYFYGDYVNSFIRYLRVDGNDNLASGPTVFATDADGPVDIQMHPDGSLYYLSINTGQLRRIAFSSGNTPPTAAASANPTNGLAPLVVSLSSAGSGDPNGDPLTFSWTFGDGSPASSAPNPQHTYTSNGTYTAILTVSDGRGGTATDTVQVVVGNRAPTARITAPTSSLRYRVGDVIRFSGTASDPDQGPLPASALSWQVILQHCPGSCHTHPFTTANGASGSFTVDDHGDDVHFEIVLTATDAGGLTHSASVTIRPQTVNITLASSPRGLQIIWDGACVNAPRTIATPVGSRHIVVAPSPQGDASFGSWSDGGAQQHSITVGTSNRTITATFAGSGGAPCPAGGGGGGDGGGGGGGGAGPSTEFAVATVSGEGAAPVGRPKAGKAGPPRITVAGGSFRPPIQARRSGRVSLLPALVYVDEAALIRVRVLSGRTGLPLLLLRQSRVGTTIVGAGRTAINHRTGGPKLMRLKLRFERGALACGSPLRIEVRATDTDGKRATAVIRALA